MKRVMLGIIVIVASLVGGCAQSQDAGEATNESTLIKPTQTITHQSSVPLEIISISSPVLPGEMVTAVIQTSPDVECQIQFSNMILPWEKTQEWSGTILSNAGRSDEQGQAILTYPISITQQPGEAEVKITVIDTNSSPREYTIATTSLLVASGMKPLPDSPPQTYYHEYIHIPLKIVSISSPLMPGDEGTIVIETIPNMTVRKDYGPRINSGVNNPEINIDSRSPTSGTDGNGRITFNFTISSDSPPGYLRVAFTAWDGGTNGSSEKLNRGEYTEVLTSLLVQ